MINSARLATWWHEKQKNVPLTLSISPAGDLELLWKGQKMI
jgi:hypothetical protein